MIVVFNVDVFCLLINDHCRWLLCCFLLISNDSCYRCWLLIATASVVVSC